MLANLASVYIANLTSHFSSQALDFKENLILTISQHMPHFLNPVIPLSASPTPSFHAHILSVKVQLQLPSSMKTFLNPLTKTNFLISWIPIGLWWCLYVYLIPCGQLDHEILASRVCPIHLCIPRANSECPIQFYWKKKKRCILRAIFKWRILIRNMWNVNSGLCSFASLRKLLLDAEFFLGCTTE